MARGIAGGETGRQEMPRHDWLFLLTLLGQHGQRLGLGWPALRSSHELPSARCLLRPGCDPGPGRSPRPTAEPGQPGGTAAAHPRQRQLRVPQAQRVGPLPCREQEADAAGGLHPRWRVQQRGQAEHQQEPAPEAAARRRVHGSVQLPADPLRAVPGPDARLRPGVAVRPPPRGEVQHRSQADRRHRGLGGGRHLPVAGVPRRPRRSQEQGPHRPPVHAAHLHRPVERPDLLRPALHLETVRLEEHPSRPAAVLRHEKCTGRRRQAVPQAVRGVVPSTTPPRTTHRCSTSSPRGTGIFPRTAPAASTSTTRSLAS